MPPSPQAVGPVAVTSLLLGNTDHGLGSLAGVSFPGSVTDPQTNKTVAYNPNSPGDFAPEQDAYNNAAHNVCPSNLHPTGLFEFWYFCKCLGFNYTWTRCMQPSST